MSDSNQNDNVNFTGSHTYKAETRQLLNILINSLYTDREIFLRELISNASDALARLKFETLTNREILDPEAELTIHLKTDKDANTLTISDSGIGMTAEELIENLGTIAHSGARAFVEAAKTQSENITDVIGQFGVGFYSAFMVADWIKVVSRSYHPKAQATAWFSDGSDQYNVENTDKDARGTDVIIKLKDDAQEFLEESRLSEIIKRHSDFVAYPIFINEGPEQINRQTAIWRQQPREVSTEEYEDFYRQLTLDFNPPLQNAHMTVDAPVQMYALLYIPSSPEKNMFSLRKEDGLQLYSRKILIQEYCRDLLPEYFGFVTGLVDSEDLPLNISRESVQTNRIMVNLKKIVTKKVIETIEEIAEKDQEKYAEFWGVYSKYIKQGVAIDDDNPEKLYPLLRFKTNRNVENWTSFDDYVARMKPDQEAIYYIMGDDEKSVFYSPHLEIIRDLDYEVLLMTDQIDAFMLVKLKKYGDHELINIATADIPVPEKADDERSSEEDKQGLEEAYASLCDRIKNVLGDLVVDVRTTNRLSGSPVRLVEPEGAPNLEMQRVYRLLDQDYEVPKKVLEINPKHKIIQQLQAETVDERLGSLIIEQLYNNALLVEGLHPEPASMVSQIQELIEYTLQDES